MFCSKKNMLQDEQQRERKIKLGIGSDAEIMLLEYSESWFVTPEN